MNSAARMIATTVLVILVLVIQYVLLFSFLQYEIPVSTEWIMMVLNLILAFFVIGLVRLQVKK